MNPDTLGQDDPRLLRFTACVLLAIVAAIQGVFAVCGIPTIGRVILGMTSIVWCSLLALAGLVWLTHDLHGDAAQGPNRA